VQQLREELAMMDLMQHLTRQQQQQHVPDAGHSSSSSGGVWPPADRYAPFSEVQRQRLRHVVLAWLQQQEEDSTGQQQQQSSLAPLPLASVAQLRELLWTFKVGGSSSVIQSHRPE
jgi:hypothetical protein